ncbi:hypothetical protein [Arenimonas fontis]|uniref:Uncharacterized protein n=1 Tax=Arenimonas fontis TaxID=2608255 RepID=A0A5B2ZFM1_9GAMM|nr:hypothetical protein [Arenimonas fontis]KAA2286030.1 hypothetical protein F0415_00560 [Arenimonas fontis]
MHTASRRLARLLVPALAFCLAGPALAAEADRGVQAKLDAKGTPYTIDDDGDFQIVVRIDDERTQLVWVRSVVEETNHQRVREIWSPGYQSQIDSFPASVANRLLEDSHARKLGGWVKQGNTAVYVIKIDADASADVLDESIDAAASIADELELDLVGGDQL